MLAAFVLAVLLLHAQQPAAPAVTTGKGVIRGQVTEKDTGRPLPRALVTLRFVGAARRILQNVADPDGRFEFTDLPAAAFEVSAAPGESRATHMPGVFEATRENRAFELAHGEVRTDVNIALPRALAIAGRVVDDEGAPLADVNVSPRIAPGAAPPSYGYSLRSRTTDDRGVFRIFGLGATRYVLCADALSYPTEAKSVGPWKPDRFVVTCFPSASSASDSQVVTLDTTDVEDVEIRMRRNDAYSISGTVVDAAGNPVDRIGLSLARFVPNGVQSIGGLAAGGRFTFSGLTPGEYAVRASVAQSDPADGREAQRAHTPVRIDAADVDGLVVTLKSAATVHGRITYDDEPPEPRRGTRVSVSALHDMETERLGGYTTGEAAAVGDDFAFTLKGLFGPLCLTVGGVPQGWIVKSIRYKGQDITEVPTEFATDPRHQIEIVLTSRAAIVSGTVTDDAGKPATDARVVLLPAAVSRWAGPLHRYPFASPGRSGRFSLPGVRPGDYLIVAVNGKRYDALQAQGATVDVLIQHAERITLVENDRLTMNLRVVPVADVR